MTMGKKLLQQMPAVSKPPAKGLDPLFVTILARRGRVNFRPLSRSCHSCERTMARPFRRCFAWPGFPPRGITVAREPCSAVLSAQDAAVLAKRGTQTCGLGPFFNGCPSRAERGLEISPLAVVDVTRRCAFTRAGAHPPNLAKIPVTHMDTFTGAQAMRTPSNSCNCSWTKAGCPCSLPL